MWLVAPILDSFVLRLKKHTEWVMVRGGGMEIKPGGNEGHPVTLNENGLNFY